MIIARFIGMTLALSWCAQAADGGPLTIWELIQRRLEFNGRMVVVRGAVGVGGHGIWLAPVGECTYKLVTKGVPWPNVINLKYPTIKSQDPDDRADFNPDWTALRRADREALHAGHDVRVNHMIATYTGLFRTFQDLENRVSPGVAGALRLGFGPGAPAQLLIKTIKDVEIAPGILTVQEIQ